MITPLKDSDGVLLAWQCTGCEEVIALSQFIPDHDKCEEPNEG